MAAAANSAYAIGTLEGRDALWSIDLADKRPPQLLFQHPLVDVGEPILQTDRASSACATTWNAPTPGTRIRRCAS